MSDTSSACDTGDSGPTSGNRTTQVVGQQEAAAAAKVAAAEAEAVAFVVQTFVSTSATEPVHEWTDTLLQAAVMATNHNHPTRPLARPPSSPVATVSTTTTSRAKASAVETTASMCILSDSHMARDTRNELTTAAAGTNHEALPSLQSIAPAAARKRYQRRRCQVNGCTKFARFNNACSGHGGRRLCAEAECARVAQFGHKCSVHGGVKLCRVEGCVRGVQSRGRCKTHGGGVRCQFADCTKGAISKGFCRSHGGGARCAAPECNKWAQRHGFCVRHSKGSTRGVAGEAMAEGKSDACPPVQQVELIATD